MKTAITAFVVILVSISASAQSVWGKPKANQCFQDPATQRDSAAKSLQTTEYQTVEQARMALRNALLDVSKECKKTDIVWRDAGYPEVGGFVVKNPNGTFGITVGPKGDNTSIKMTMPDNAVESMHTHPFQVSKGEGTALGTSGQDMLTSAKLGIPVFALDCASGEVLGVTEKGEAIKLVCDERGGTCSVAQVTDVETDWMFIAGFVPERRDFSQAIAQKRLDEELDKQRKISMQS